MYHIAVGYEPRDEGKIKIQRNLFGFRYSKVHITKLVGIAGSIGKGGRMMTMIDDILIKNLREQVLNFDINPEQFLTLIKKISHGHQRRGRIVDLGQRLFRAVSWKETGRPSHISRISYPPKDLAKLNRANLPRQQVFYCSAGLATPILETKLTEGGLFIASEWSNIDRIGLQEVGLRDGQNELSHPLEQLFHDIFTSKNTKMYQYSAPLSDFLMQGDELHGLLYSSVISDVNQHNIVLKKDFVDKNLRFVNAYLYRLNKINGSKYDVTELDFALSDDQVNLDWKGRKAKWSINSNTQTVAVVNAWGLWEVRDENNDLMYPN